MSTLIAAYACSCVLAARAYVYTGRETFLMLVAYNPHSCQPCLRNDKIRAGTRKELQSNTLSQMGESCTQWIEFVLFSLCGATFIWVLQLVSAYWPYQPSHSCCIFAFSPTWSIYAVTIPVPATLCSNENWFFSSLSNGNASAWNIGVPLKFPRWLNAVHSLTLARLACLPGSAVNGSYVTADLNCSPSVEM